MSLSVCSQPDSLAWAITQRSPRSEAACSAQEPGSVGKSVTLGSKRLCLHTSPEQGIGFLPGFSKWSAQHGGALLTFFLLFWQARDLVQLVWIQFGVLARKGLYHRRQRDSLVAPAGAKYTTHQHARAFTLEHAYKQCAHSVLRQLIDPVISLAL